MLFGFFSLILSKNINKLFYPQSFFLKMWTSGQRILTGATPTQSILGCRERAVKSWKGPVHLSPNQKLKQRQQQVTGYQTESAKIFSDFWDLFSQPQKWQWLFGCLRVKMCLWEKKCVFIQKCPWIPAGSCNTLVPVSFLPFSVPASAERTPVSTMKGFVGSYTPSALQNSF